MLSDIIINKNDEIYVDQHDYGEKLIGRLREVFERVKNIYEKINATRQQAIEDAVETHFNVGDKVLLYDPTTKIGLSRKMTVRWRGPYVVMEKVNDVNYVINIQGKMLKVHKHRLRPFHSHSTAIDELIESENILAEEIEKINELELELRAKKIEKEHQLEIAKAQRAVADDEAVQVATGDNNVEPVIDALVYHLTVGELALFSVFLCAIHYIYNLLTQTQSSIHCQMS
jgi:nitrogen regulatory protein PII/rRNA processing protein Gar1